MYDFNRLTKRDAQGNWQLEGVRWIDIYTGAVITKEIWDKLYGALWKLMEYEDTGLSPEEVEQLKYEAEELRRKEGVRNG